MRLKTKKKLLSHSDTRKSVSASATKDRLLTGMLTSHATGLPNRWVVPMRAELTRGPVCEERTNGQSFLGRSDVHPFSSAAPQQPTRRRICFDINGQVQTCSGGRTNVAVFQYYFSLPTTWLMPQLARHGRCSSMSFAWNLFSNYYLFRAFLNTIPREFRL